MLDKIIIHIELAYFTYTLKMTFVINIVNGVKELNIVLRIFHSYKYFLFYTRTHIHNFFFPVSFFLVLTFKTLCKISRFSLKLNSYANMKKKKIIECL